MTIAIFVMYFCYVFTW